MKQLISTFLLTTLLTLSICIVPASAITPPVDRYATDPGDFGLCPRGTVRVRKHTAHRTKVKHALLSGLAGAVGGGLLGGKKGIVIGAGAGAGGYLLYRYIKDRHGKCVLRRA